VFNLKWGVLAGSFAFLLSLVVGLLSRTGYFALLRALAFGVLFFLMGCGAYWLLSRFLSELLEVNREGVPENALGSAVDISLEDEDSSPLTGDGALGENGLDQNGEDGYTKEGAVENEPFPESGGGYAASFPGRAAAVPGAATDDAVDELPDLDAMAAAFIPSRDNEARAAEGPGESLFLSPSGVPAGDKKVRDLAEEFKTNDMASAVQTILKREKG
jgi:hypothetical protein